MKNRPEGPAVSSRGRRAVVADGTTYASTEGAAQRRTRRGWRVLLPDLHVDSVLRLDLPRVRRLGLDALILDIDNTLKPHGIPTFDSDVQSWVAALRSGGDRGEPARDQQHNHDDQQD